MLVLFQEKSGGIYDTYIQHYQAQNQKLHQVFKSTLNMLSNGVMLIDQKTHDITFVNNEMRQILGAAEEDERSLSSKVCQFHKYED